jgi:predicted RNase H-like HicB family nuclease
MQVTLTAIFFDDDGGVTGFVEEFLDVSAHGRNLKDARAKLTKALRERLEQEPGEARYSAGSYGPVTRERIAVEFWRRDLAAFLMGE